LADATAREQAARQRVAELGQGAGRLLRRRELADNSAWLTPPARWRGSRPTVPPTRSGRPARHTDLLAGDCARARELAWRGRVDVRAVELERPGWLRELGEPPATVKGQRALRQQRLGQRERAHVDQPRSRSTRADRAQSPRADERERGGREREAG
jgi:hypothetical protein